MAYKVLWVDDEYDTPALQEVADLASDRNINMDTACKSAEEALDHLEHPRDFDAVILDIRFFKTQSDTLESSGRIKGLRKVTDRLKQLKDKGCWLPTFIYSGQPDIYNSEDFKDTYEDYPLFQKTGEGTNQLFAAIIKAVDEKVETKVKLNYSPLFDVCSSHYMFDSSLTERLLNYAGQIDQNDVKKPEYLNDIRKLIEELFEKCEQVGLLVPGIQSLNDKSKFLCDNKMQEYIAPYVQESIRFILRCTQEGSHDGVADSDMRNGVAPFLFRSLFFALSNVLIWWKQFIDSGCDKDELKQYVESIQIESDPAKKEKKTEESERKATTPRPYTYIVEKDSDGFYHCGPYLMPTKHGQVMEGKTVSVLEEEGNTGKKSDVYRKFAKRVQEVR